VERLKCARRRYQEISINGLNLYRRLSIPSHFSVRAAYFQRAARAKSEVYPRKEYGCFFVSLNGWSNVVHSSFFSKLHRRRWRTPGWWFACCVRLVYSMKLDISLAPRKQLVQAQITWLLFFRGVLGRNGGFQAESEDCGVLVMALRPACWDSLRSS
jgi:hypothetical protein